VKQDHGDTQADDEREKGRTVFYRFQELDHYFLLRLASRLSDDASWTHGTSTDVNRTHPVSVW
jgi:hypothetical protein